MTHPATLLKNSLSAYAKDLRGWLLLTLPLAMLAAVFVVLDWLQMLDGFELLSRLGGLSIWKILITVLVFIIIIAAIIFISRVFSSATIHASYRTLGGQKTNIKESYRVGYNLFWPVLWVAVLRGLIITGGLLLLIVPGVIWALQYSLATQAVVVEGKRGRDALRRSKELTKGRLLETIINFGVIGVVFGYGAWLFSAAIILILIILSGVISYTIPAEAYANANIVVGVIALASQAAILWLAIPLSPLAIMSVYKDFSGK